MTLKTVPTTVPRRTLLQGAAATALLAALPLRSRPVLAQGLLPTVLNVELADVENNGVEVRTYNGMTPGPTLSALPGEALEVSLTNSLDAQTEEEYCPENMNQLHATNSTNFHTHGLHVSPYKSEGDKFDSDNIFLSVIPEKQSVPSGCGHGEIRRGGTNYRFELPDDHPSGTFWYHAHKHGSTALQVGNGLLGPLIVRDKPGVMPPYIEKAKEDILVIQMRDVKDPEVMPGDSDGTPQLVLADPSGQGGGIKNPTIELRPGEVRRWRIINAAPRADTFVSLNLQGVDGGEALDVYQIAFDGITYDKRIKIDTTNNGAPWENPAALAPGNRTDFMVRVPPDAAAGRLQLVALQLPNEMVEGAQAMPGTEQLSDEMKLDVVIAGDPVDAEWPDDPTLPGGGPLVKPIDPGEVVYDREVEFFLDFNAPQPKRFMIDRKEFDGSVLEPKMKLGTAERWKVTNRNTFTHPFHIHVNPFFVTHINGKELAQDDPLRRWQDTMAIPTAAKHDEDPPGSFTMLSRFVRFTGKFVIHCHILEHEDEGMMKAVEVVS